MATSPLAQSSPQESKTISACSTNHWHMVPPTDVGLLILSLDRSTLDRVQPQFLSQASVCCGALSPRVAVAEGLVRDSWDDGLGLSGAGWDGAYVASTTDGVGEV